MFYCFLLVAISSCAFIAREIIAPNNCKKCVLIGPSGEEVWSEDDCGGGVANMETRCKVEAYDRGCDYKCSCESYKNEND